MKGQVYKVFSEKYTVNANGKNYVCTAKGLLKHKKEAILVGDFVEFEDGVILKVCPRKNTIIRPNVSNVDYVAVVVSPIPKPDYYLIDKVILNASLQGITPIIIVNKNDVDDSLYSDVVSQYKNVVKEIYISSIYDKVLIDKLKDKLKGKFCVLAGQSAVGKTSLINVLFNKQMKTGEVSDKILRGKHTTTSSEIHKNDEFLVIDSPGFAVIEPNVKSQDLKEYYPEFLEYFNECRFRGCNHIDEPDCQIKNMVKEERISPKRYERYVQMYKELKLKEKVYERN